MKSGLINRLAPPFLSIIKRIRRARLRRIMRGYRVLKQSGRLDRIALVKQALTEHPLDLTRQNFSPLLMGAGTGSGEIIVRQYLLVRVGGINLNCALLLALSEEQGRVVFPLPREWRDVLTQHGFKVARFKSALLWQCYVCALLAYGVVQIARVVFSGSGSGKGTVLNQKRHVYFAALGSGNLPQKVNGSQSHDVISWYLQWPGRKPDIESVHHGVANSLPVAVGSITVLPQPRPLPVLTGWGAILNYAVWGLGASVIAALCFLRGRWWHALLLNQAALAAQVRQLPTNALAREYLFHNSGWIYRPLWTYEAERLGSAITFYFYSTNCESFKKPDGYPPISFGYGAMNWPRYLVWDEYQADFVRRAVGDHASIDVVGDIWFQSAPVKMPTLLPRSVAVFDVQPVREGFYRTLGADFEYYIPKMAVQFLADIQDVLHEENCSLALKRKRQIGKLAHPSYRRYLKSLGESSNFSPIDPGIDAPRLIEKCVAVISMPFTSTALLGRESGKPSVYYDPLGLLQKDDRAAHGVEILQGQEELQRWLIGVLKDPSGDGLMHA